MAQRTIDVGLTGPDIRATTAFNYSESHQLNETGQVLGYSSDSMAAARIWASTWLYYGAATIDVGLTGPEYTFNDGYQI